MFWLCSCLSLSLPPSIPGPLVTFWDGHHLTYPLGLRGGPKTCLGTGSVPFSKRSCSCSAPVLAPPRRKLHIPEPFACWKPSCKAGAIGSSWCVDPSQGGERDLELQNEASVTQIKRFLIPFPSASPGRGEQPHTHNSSSFLHAQLMKSKAKILPSCPGKGVCPTRQRGHGGCGPNPCPGGELEVREKQ